MGREQSDDRGKGGWVETICGLPLVYQSGEKSIRQHFEPARGHLSDRTAFLAAVRTWLSRQPELIGAWQRYSEDKRASGPYLDLRKLKVGIYEASPANHDARVHSDPVDACAEFIYREAMWVLECR